MRGGTRVARAPRVFAPGISRPHTTPVASMALVAILVGACASASPAPSGAPPAREGGTGTPTGSCATLAACCPKAPATQQAACNTVASDDDQSACSNDLPSFQSAGYCPVTGDYPPGPYGMAAGMTFPD